MANESDQPIVQAAKDLGINVNTLHTCINKYSRPDVIRIKPSAPTSISYEELKRLKQEEARLTEERDLLKKAPRTLPRSSGKVRLDQRPCR